MSWKRWLGAAMYGRTTGARAGTTPTVDQVRVALEQRGVPAEFSSVLAERVADQLVPGDARQLESLLDGVAMAIDLQQSTQEQLTRSLRGLREVERMMGAFSGELSKLDEVLGVLAAYVRRMKTSGGGSPDRVLH